MDPRLQDIEAYYDAVPRAIARAEDVGPFTLFVNDGPGWPFYARPSQGRTSFTVDDLRRVLERQRELGVPQSLEWVDDLAPGLRAVAVDAGLEVHHHPLMLLQARPSLDGLLPGGISLRLATLEDDLATLGAVAALAFASPGTGAGSVGAAQLTEAARARSAELVVFERRRLSEGRTVMAVAFDADLPVSVGSHQPVGRVTEIVGVGTLPSYRRRGIASAVTALLAEDALRRGVEIVFLSAGDDTVARVYERVGFRRIATACVAEAVAAS